MPVILGLSILSFNLVPCVLPFYSCQVSNTKRVFMQSSGNCESAEIVPVFAESNTFLIYFLRTVSPLEGIFFLPVYMKMNKEKEIFFFCFSFLFVLLSVSLL